MKEVFMNRKKMIAAGLAAVTSMTMLAGCGGNSNSSSAGGDSAPAAGSQAADPAGTQSSGGKEVVIWDYFETDAQK